MAFEKTFCMLIIRLIKQLNILRQRCLERQQIILLSKSQNKKMFDLVHCHNGTAHPRLKVGEDGLHIWNVPVNVLNRQWVVIQLGGLKLKKN